MKAAASLATVHHPHSHRLDAKEVAAAFGITLRTLAGVLNVKETTLRTRSHSANLQPALRKLVLAYDGLGVVFPADEIRKWMHHPLRSLQGLTPLELLRDRGVASFEALVDEVVGGGYS